MFTKLPVQIVGSQNMCHGDFLLAETSGQRAQGLAGFTADDLVESNVKGMVFLYREDVYVPFSGAGCKLDLAIGFYGADGTFLGWDALDAGSTDPVWPLGGFRVAVEVPLDDAWMLPGDLRARILTN